MKVIFLDVDGVLNSTKSGYGFGGELDKNKIKWDQTCVDRVRALVEAVETSVVISSTWRIGTPIQWFKDAFALYGWHNAPVVGKTPEDVHHGFRGEEVYLWLENNPTVETFLCIDDETDFYPQQNFIRTVFNLGFTEENLQQAIDTFRSPMV